MQIFPESQSQSLVRGVGVEAGAALNAGVGVEPILRKHVSARTPQMLISEVLFHGRPFFHLWMLIRRGRKSWLAWFLVLLVDQLSVGMLNLSVQISFSNPVLE